jgi:3-phenylpropionate/cinnamic acid dioxygenase small subunit
MGGPDDDALRRRIEALQLDYVHSIDDGELDRWPGFFTDPCLYRVTGRDNFDAGLELGVMRFEGRDMLRDRVTSTLHTALFAPRRLCHVLSGTRIDGRDGDGITARTNVAIYQTSADGDTLLLMAAQYRDLVVAVDDRLLFREKHVVYDTIRLPDTVIFPL